MKELLSKYLGKKIKLEPYYYGAYTLFDVEDNYFVVKNEIKDIKKYIPYTSILEISENYSGITITLIFVDMDEFLDDLGDKFNSY